MSGDHQATIKLLIDEDLSPWVAQQLRVHDLLDAIHVRDRAHLGCSDRKVFELAFSEDRILVTANILDFERLARARDLHAGIVLVLEGNLLRHEQLVVLRDAVRAIVRELSDGRDMVNRLLRISFSGTAQFLDAP